MRESERVNELGAALAALVGKLDEIGNPKKGSRAKIQTKKGGEFSYAYLDLPSLLAVIRGPLHECGLAILQHGEPMQGGIGMVTRVMHLSGQWIEGGPLFVPVADPTDPKAVGSAETYGMRYGICSMLGIAGEEDDDGQRASVKVEPRPPSQDRTEGGPGVQGRQSPGPGMADTEGAQAAPGSSLRGKEQPTAADGAGGGGDGIEHGAPSSPAVDEYLKTLRSGKGGPRRALAKAQEMFGKPETPSLASLTLDQMAQVALAIQTEDRDEG